MRSARSHCHERSWPVVGAATKQRGPLPVKLEARGGKHSARAGRITELENGARSLGSRPATHELKQKLVEQKPENRKQKPKPAPPSPHCRRGGVSPAPPPARVLRCAPPPPRGVGAAGVGEGPQCGAMQGNGGWHLGWSAMGAGAPTAPETDDCRSTSPFPPAQKRPGSGSVCVLRWPKTPARTRGRRHHQRRHPSSAQRERGAEGAERPRKRTVLTMR